MKSLKNQDVRAMDTLRIYAHATWHYKKDSILMFLNLLSAVLTTVALPFFISKTLADIMTGGHHTTYNLVILAIISVSSVITNRIGFNHFMLAQAKSLRDLNQLVFDRLMVRSSGYHHNNISGKIISDITDFLTSYASFMQGVFMTGSTFVLSLIVGLVVIFINSWQLGIFVAVVVMILEIWVVFESFTRSELRAKRLIATKALTSHVADSIVNVQAVKAFAREKDEARNNVELSQKLYELRAQDWLRAGRSGNKRRGFLVIMQLLLVSFIACHVKRHPEAMAAGIFAFSYTLTPTIRLFDIDMLIRQVEEVFLNASPITKMLGEEIEIRDKPGAEKLVVKKGAINLQDVFFSYAEAKKDTDVFADLTLAIKGGEKIGLVGSSGGGKSTLTRILLRFEDIQSGSVTIDGQDIRDVTQTSLRKAIAYVPQEPMLFHRSVRENICYGKPKATDAEVIDAAKKAHAHEFIQQFSDGYGTVVGERGVKLSGGQRQRIAIARAILKDAPILILDEATSALDSESEIYIQEALINLMKNRTTLVIAHRLSTIQRMDRIIVLDEGRIVEQGSHQELIDQKGTYAKLWQHQSGGFLKA